MADTCHVDVPCMLDLHQLGPDTAGYRSVSFYICPLEPQARPTAGTHIALFDSLAQGDRGIKAIIL